MASVISEQHDRDRAAAAEVEDLHGLGERPERQHLRRLRRTAAGQAVDDVEGLQRIDDRQHQHDGDRGPKAGSVT